MKIHLIFLVILLALGSSCRKSISNEELTNVLDTIPKKLIQAEQVMVKLNPKAKKEVGNWTEYNKMDDFIRQYYSISKTDAIFNSIELSELAQQLKDTIRVEKFEIPSVKIRLNVLHTETLRLADMGTIPNISEIEVKKENENILYAFSALNLKLNNIIDQEDLNKNLSEFINEVNSTTINEPAEENEPAEKNKNEKILK